MENAMSDGSISRRTLLQGVGVGATLASVTTVAGAEPAATAAARRPSPDAALALLKKGNSDFLAGKPIAVDPNGRRRLQIAKGQEPFAVLVSCSDSRVPPEVLFGRGLGELFIVRNAGNTVDTAAMGSIEYAVAELKVPLVVVMGHERCGAVAAALSVVEKNAVYPGSIGRMVEPIVPAVLQARAAGGDWLDASVRGNVMRTVARLRTASEPLLLDPLKAGKLKIVGAYYDLDDGRVTFFD